MKTKLWIFVLVLLPFLFSITNVNALDTGVLINESNFPNEGFRDSIKKFDLNNDNILSDQELNNVKKMNLRGNQIKSIVGIEHVSSMTELDITNTSIETFDYKNLPNSLKKLVFRNNQLLSGINLANNQSVTDIEFSSNNPQLKNLDFRGSKVERAHHCVNQETVYISAGMTKYIGCYAIPQHTGNIVIDLNGWYTVNADGSKSVDMTQVVSPTLLAVLEKSNNSAYNPQNKILTISPKEKVTKIQAGFDANRQPTYWTFFTEMTNINDCVVRFESNGGTDISDQIVEYGKLAVEPQQPTKPGYVFKGWYLDQEMKKAYDFSNAVTDNIQLYAKWEMIQNSNTPDEDKKPEESKDNNTKKEEIVETKTGDSEKNTNNVKTGDSEKNTNNVKTGDSEKNTNNVKTGDSAQLEKYMAVALLSVMIMILMIVRKKIMRY